MLEIATPPDIHARGADDPIGSMLEWAGRITGAARVLLVWEEQEEPSLELALWDGRECRRMRERPDAFNPLVAAEVERADFLHRPPAPCLVALPDGFRHWDGEPLHAEFRARFSVGPVFAIRLTGEEVAGRLLFLDKPHMTSDDLILGEILAQQLASRLSVSYLIRRLEEKAVIEERLRLARDLHDGTFHSFMGMALEVERLLRMPGLELADARRSLLQMQRNLQDEQRTLRMLIESLRASDPPPWTVDASLGTRLKDLVSRLERQRGLKIDVRAADLSDFPPGRWVDVCLIVHEALVNVARHAGAPSCRWRSASGTDRRASSWSTTAAGSRSRDTTITLSSPCSI
jgi:signal transduction histidine kinase